MYMTQHCCDLLGVLHYSQQSELRRGFYNITFPDFTRSQASSAQIKCWATWQPM